MVRCAGEITASHRELLEEGRVPDHSDRTLRPVLKVAFEGRETAAATTHAHSMCRRTTKRSGAMQTAARQRNLAAGAEHVSNFAEERSGVGISKSVGTSPRARPARAR